MSRCEDIVQNKDGKLLTYQTTVIVDITITTTLVRAAEHIGSPVSSSDATIIWQIERHAEMV
jgi:hypothetical protein